MKNLQITTLGDDYCDQRALIAHAAFQCLVNFIEVEDAEHVIIWDENDESKRIWKEIKDLYDWWKVNSDREEGFLDDTYYNELQTNLHRLIDIRGYIWV